MKRAIVLMLAILSLFTTCRAESAWVLCQPDSSVNIREFPKKSAAVIAWGYAGDKIELDGKRRGQWLHCLVPSESGDGWIREDYVSTDEPEDVGSGIFETMVGRVRVRASANGRVVRKLKKGARVTVSMVTAEWCVTNYGFIRTNLLMEVPAE